MWVKVKIIGDGLVVGLFICGLAFRPVTGDLMSQIWVKVKMAGEKEVMLITGVSSDCLY
ncbi:hypothetical protein V6259_14870 [Marinomonas sp. TI.3.20]|uniref:hypothetical protein n=1 Tax=Marinomonas sp. TI.3.20 TaxID=3121296 RepID=UPI00311DE820